MTDKIPKTYRENFPEELMRLLITFQDEKELTSLRLVSKSMKELVDKSITPEQVLHVLQGLLFRNAMPIDMSYKKLQLFMHYYDKSESLKHLNNSVKQKKALNNKAIICYAFFTNDINSIKTNELDLNTAIAQEYEVITDKMNQPNMQLSRKHELKNYLQLLKVVGATSLAIDNDWDELFKVRFAELYAMKTNQINLASIALNSAKFKNLNFYFINFYNANLQNMIFENELDYGTIFRCSFVYANLKNSRISVDSLEYCDCRDADLSNVTINTQGIYYVDFSHANLTGIKITYKLHQGFDLHDGIFENIDVTDAIFFSQKELEDTEKLAAVLDRVYNSFSLFDNQKHIKSEIVKSFLNCLDEMQDENKKVTNLKTAIAHQCFAEHRNPIEQGINNFMKIFSSNKTLLKTTAQKKLKEKLHSIESQTGLKKK